MRRHIEKEFEPTLVPEPLVPPGPKVVVQPPLDIVTLQAENMRLRAKILNLESQVERSIHAPAMSADIVNLQAENASLQSKIQSLQTQLESSQKQIQDFQKTIFPFDTPERMKEEFEILSARDKDLKAFIPVGPDYKTELFDLKKRMGGSETVIDYIERHESAPTSSALRFDISRYAVESQEK